MTTSPKRTYWQTMIRTDGGRGTEHGYCGCSVGLGEATLAATLAEAFRTGSYYLGLGYRVQIDDCEQHCTDCRGLGKVRRGSRLTPRYVRCPACHGRGVLQTVETQTEIHLSESLTVTHDAHPSIVCGANDWQTVTAPEVDTRTLDERCDDAETQAIIEG